MKSLRNRPIIGVLVIFILYILFLAIPIFFIFPYLAQCYQFTLLSSLLIHFIFIMGFLLLLLLFVIPYGLHLPIDFTKYSKYLKVVGLSKLKPFKKIAFTTLLCAMFFIGFGMIGSIMLGQTVFDFALLFQAPTTNSYGYFTFIRQLCPAFCEELAFRGIILSLLLNKYSEKKAVTINGILFGIMHLINLLQGAELFSTLFQVIYATILGIFFAFTFNRTGSLIPSIIIHYLINIFSNIYYQTTGTFIEFGISILLIGIMLPSLINILIVKEINR